MWYHLAAPHGPFYIFEMSKGLKAVEDGLKGVQSLVLVVGPVLFLCHTGLKGMLGEKCHVREICFAPTQSQCTRTV